MGETTLRQIRFLLTILVVVIAIAAFSLTRAMRELLQSSKAASSIAPYNDAAVQERFTSIESDILSARQELNDCRKRLEADLLKATSEMNLKYQKVEDGTKSAKTPGGGDKAKLLGSLNEFAMRLVDGLQEDRAAFAKMVAAIPDMPAMGGSKTTILSSDIRKSDSFLHPTIGVIALESVITKPLLITTYSIELSPSVDKWEVLRASAVMNDGIISKPAVDVTTMFRTAAGKIKAHAAPAP